MTFRRLPNRFRGQGDAIMFLKFFTHLPERMIHPKIRDHPLQRRGHTPATYPRRGGKRPLQARTVAKQPFGHFNQSVGAVPVAFFSP